MLRHNKNIQKKLTSLSLMAIMVAGGMTFAIPGVTPDAMAQSSTNANLYVSTTTFGGPMIVEIIVNDSNYGETDEVEAEPDVTFDGNDLRMTQANDGKWYAYVASTDELDVFTKALGIGTTCTDDLDDFSDADTLFCGVDELVRNHKEPTAARDSITLGQINLPKNTWPFIQTFNDFADDSTLKVVYGTSPAQTINVVYTEDMDDFPSYELDRQTYPHGADVHITINDNQLNIDPTDEDTWTFVTADDADNTETYYYAFETSGDLNTKFLVKDIKEDLGKANFGDNGFLIIDPMPNTDESLLVFVDNDEQDSNLAHFTDKNIITFQESEPNSGMFDNTNTADNSNLKTTDNADIRGLDFIVDYNDDTTNYAVDYTGGSVTFLPTSIEGVWNSGESITVMIEDADFNKNTKSDNDYEVHKNPDAAIPTIQIGEPITLGNYDNSDQPNYNLTSQDFSDRGILTTDGDELSLEIPLDITADELGAFVGDNTEVFNLINYDLRSLNEKADISLVVNGDTFCIASDASGQDSILLEHDRQSCDNKETIAIPLLYNSGSAYESQHFGTAFDKAVSDYEVDSKTFSSLKRDLGINPIQAVLDAGAKGAVGTYTSEQLRILNNTGKIGTDDGQIVLLSYSSAAQSFAEPGDGIFRLTTDTSRQVESIITELIPIADFDNVISIHLNDAWSKDYVAALEATYGDNHRTIAYNTDAKDITVEFSSVLTGLSGNVTTAIVILEYNHDRLDALIEELARKDGNSNAYAGIETTKFIIPDVPSAAFGSLTDAALALLQDTDMQTIKFALSGNNADQERLNDVLDQAILTEVNFDSDGNIFDRHAYAAYDAGQILTRAINGLGTDYTSADLAAAIPTAAKAYSSDALIYRTVLDSTTGDLECMVYDIFEIDDVKTGFELSAPKQATTDATNCPITTTPVVPSNAVPVISSVNGPREVVENQPLTLTVVATDDNNDSLTYSANNTETVSANNDNVFVFTPTSVGTANIQFTVDDGNGGTDTEVVTIDVRPVPIVNVAPSFTATSVTTTATVGERLTFMVEGTDDNPGDSPESLTFEMTQPQGQTATATLTAAGNFTWTPVAADIGRNTFTFVAIDDENTRSDPVSIVITVDAAPVDPNVPNVAPVIDTSNAVTQATVDQAVTFTVDVTDANPADTRNTIRLTATAQVTNNPTVNPTTGVFTWTPVTADIGDKVFTFTAMDDGGERSTAQVTITVSAATNGQTPDPNVPNVAPVIDTSNAVTQATVDQAVTFTVDVTDANPADTRNTIRLTATAQVTNNPTVNPTTGVFTWTPVTADIGDKVFTFTAMDDGGERSTAQVTITVNAAADVRPTRGSDFDTTVTIPLLHDRDSAYEMEHFGAAFDKAVDDYDDPAYKETSQTINPTKLPLTATPTQDIQSVLNTDVKGAVGTYTSEQLKTLDDTGKIGTDDGDIVMLSYASTSAEFANPNDGIFRLTVDTQRQVNKILNEEVIPGSEFDQIISIQRDDAWSNSYADALEDEYGANHRTISYDGSVADTDFSSAQDTINATLKHPSTGLLPSGAHLDAQTAIILLEFTNHSLDVLTRQLSEQNQTGHFVYTGINTTQLIIPDIPDGTADTFENILQGDPQQQLLIETNLKTIKFALNDINANHTALKNDLQASATVTVDSDGNIFDRHAYSAYDAGQILARAIDALGKDHTAAQLATMIPFIAEEYSDDALIYNTKLNADGDLACMVYDVFEVDATSGSTHGITFQAPEKVTTDATNCPIPGVSPSSSTILSNPQTVSCIDCAINSFGEIFGQTVQVQQTTQSDLTPLEQFLNASGKVSLQLNFQKAIEADTYPIVLDLFKFGQDENGRYNDAIYRFEPEETNTDTGVYEGTVEYVMLNQINRFDEDTFTGLATISDELDIIVHEDLTDEDAVEMIYYDHDDQGVQTQTSDQQTAPTHSAVVEFDGDNYKVADTVTIKLTDADLNTDSDVIDIYTTVGDVFGRDIGNGTLIDGSLLLDVTFDDKKWVACADPKYKGLAGNVGTLRETEKASGVFMATFQIPEMQCVEIDGKPTDPKSPTGLDIEVNYQDFRDASGEEIEVGDSAGIRASTGSVTFDRTVYPVPFAGNVFPLHPSINEDGEAFKEAELTNPNAKYLSEGKTIIHVRVSDSDYDISASGEDKIASGTTGPIKVTVSRGQNNDKVVATAGAATANATANEYGPILEIAPDAGIFEADIPISYKDGPKDGCPEYPTPQNNMFKDGCVLQGDIITVQYTDPTDASGEPNSVTDSATFDLRNAVLQSDKSVYIIGSDMILTLIEPDLDLDNDGAETYPLDLVEWDSDAGTTSMGKFGTDPNAFDPEPNAFRETGDSTGIFQVVVEMPEELDGDKLERGEEIELEYTDWGPSGSDHVGDEDEDINLTVFTSNFGSTVELDQKVYTWTDKVYITIVAPDHNFDDKLVDEIGNTNDDPIRIATRGADIDNYKLVETGTDTGIFTGEVILTGFAHDVDGDSINDVTPKTEGSGPTDGFLATEDDDGLSVSFEFSEDETVVGSALVRWNIGEVQWLEASYAASGTGVVRVVDPDMNLNPESVDNFEVNVWSDSDVGGIDLTVTETNQATGIFEGTAFFTVSDTSSGHRLRVSEGDTVTAEYNDRTLPDPHDTSDEIDITATTLIGSIIPPLERAPATNLRVVDTFSNTLDTLTVDQQVQITADLSNGQDKDQPFAYIVQIQNEGSVTVALAWVSGTLTPSQSFSPALSWTPSEAGTYTATAFVWESVDNPTALSPPNELTITVN